MPKRPSPLSARRLADLKREVAEYGWWADDLGLGRPFLSGSHRSALRTSSGREQNFSGLRSLSTCDRTIRPGLPARIPRAAAKSQASSTPRASGRSRSSWRRQHPYQVNASSQI